MNEGNLHKESCSSAYSKQYQGNTCEWNCYNYLFLHMNIISQITKTPHASDYDNSKNNVTYVRITPQRTSMATCTCRLHRSRLEPHTS